MTVFIQSFLAAKQAMDAILAHAFGQAFLSSLSGLTHGSLTSRITAVLIVAGLTYMFRHGIWKIILSVVGHSVLARF